MRQHLTSWRQRQPRWYPVVIAVIVIWGSALRIAHLSSGTLFRDDAWVALSTRVNFETAWQMVGASPGYIMGIRSWIGLVGQTTWLMQLPTLMVSIASLVLFVALARWWGLSHVSTSVGLAVLASSRVAVEYSTHLKPYSHDIFMASLLLASAAAAQRPRGRWFFAVVAAGALMTSLTALPLVLGLMAVVAVRHARAGHLRRLALPAGLLGLPTAVVTWIAVRNLSPRLHESWKANFVDFSTPSSIVRSGWNCLRGLLWGLVDTTPRVGLNGVGLLVTIVSLLFIGIGIVQRGRSSLPASALACGGLAAALSVMPLGTGRTDAYLYVPILLLFGAGLDRVVSTSSRPLLRNIALGAALIVGLVGLSDASRHPHPYPGGDFHLVSQAAEKHIAQGGSVIVEGTARWPWTYYVAPRFELVFSSKYNTGFAPVVSQPHVVVMPGSPIEGEYHPQRAVDALEGAPQIMTIRADDWEIANPLGPALHRSCYLHMQHQHVPGYFIDTWEKVCEPN